MTVLEQRVAEKRQFTMADLLPTEAPCQIGVEPARKRRLVLNCTVASRSGVEGLTKLFVIPIAGFCRVGRPQTLGVLGHNFH